MKYFIVLSAFGLLCGLINGMLGTGGGLAAYLALYLLYRGRDDEKKIFASTNAVILLLSPVSAWVYYRKGALTPEVLTEYAPMIVPALAGGLFGAYLLRRFDVRLVKKLFCAMIAFAGLRMVLG